MTTPTRLLVALALCATALPAVAQDVVVMRRTIAPPAPKAAPKTTTCNLVDDSIINAFTSDGGNNTSINTPIDGKTPAQVKAMTLAFCQGFAWTKSCQGYVYQNTSTLSLYASGRTADVRTTTQIYGSPGKTYFPQAYSGTCTPAQ